MTEETPQTLLEAAKKVIAEAKPNLDAAQKVVDEAIASRELPKIEQAIRAYRKVEASTATANVEIVRLETEIRNEATRSLREPIVAAVKATFATAAKPTDAFPGAARVAFIVDVSEGRYGMITANSILADNIERVDKALVGKGVSKGGATGPRGKKEFSVIDKNGQPMGTFKSRSLIETFGAVIGAEWKTNALGESAKSAISKNADALAESLNKGGYRVTVAVANGGSS